jgi:hypothetical protein
MNRSSQGASDYSKVVPLHHMRGEEASEQREVEVVLGVKSSPSPRSQWGLLILVPLRDSPGSVDFLGTTDKQRRENGPCIERNIHGNIKRDRNDPSLKVPMKLPTRFVEQHYLRPDFEIDLWMEHEDLPNFPVLIIERKPEGGSTAWTVPYQLQTGIIAVVEELSTVLNLQNATILGGTLVGSLMRLFEYRKDDGNDKIAAREIGVFNLSNVSQLRRAYAQLETSLNHVLPLWISQHTEEHKQKANTLERIPRQANSRSKPSTSSTPPPLTLER